MLMRGIVVHVRHLRVNILKGNMMLFFFLRKEREGGKEGGCCVSLGRVFFLRKFFSMK